MSVPAADDGPFVSDDDELDVNTSRPLGIQRVTIDERVDVVAHNGVHTSAPIAGSDTLTCADITAVLAVPSDVTELHYGVTTSVSAGQY